MKPTHYQIEEQERPPIMAERIRMKQRLYISMSLAAGVALQRPAGLGTRNELRPPQNDG